MLRRRLKPLVAVAVCGVLIVFAIAASITVDRQSTVELPPPTGQFAVGRAIYDWRDASHEVLAWVWYPAAHPANVADDYVPAQMRAHSSPPGAPFSWITRDVSKIRAHAIADAPMPPEGTYPVVFLRGGGSSSALGYTTLAEDLASHGYVVAGIDVPLLTSVVVFPDGRVARRTEENDLDAYPDEEEAKVAGRLLGIYTSHMSFALDSLAELNASDPSSHFTGHLDLTRVGAFGHSFGGAQSAQFCHDDARCGAAIDIDGMLFGSVVQEGMPKPFMFLMEDFSGPPGPDGRALLADMQSLYRHVPAETRQCVWIRGANHFLFGDDGIAHWSRPLLGLLRTLRVLKIDGTRQVAVTRYAVRSFFDAHLKEKSKARLNLLSREYLELEALDVQ
jgi:dienelactone hydrolase